MDHLRSRRYSLFSTGFASLICLLNGGIALVWIKMRSYALIVTGGFAVFGLATAWSVISIFLAIGGRELITGQTQFVTPQGYFDLAKLQPGAGTPAVLASYEKLTDLEKQHAMGSVADVV